MALDACSVDDELFDWKAEVANEHRLQFISRRLENICWLQTYGAAPLETALM
jgi:hypothetical protein